MDKSNQKFGVEINLQAGDKRYAIGIKIVGLGAVIGILIMLKQFGVW